MREPFLMIPKEIFARKDITSGAKIAYAILLDRAGEKGICWPGMRRLSYDCGMSYNAIKRAILSLQAAGVISTKKREPGQSNIYRLIKSASETEALPDRKSAFTSEAPVRNESASTMEPKAHSLRQNSASGSDAELNKENSTKRTQQSLPPKKPAALLDAPKPKRKAKPKPGTNPEVKIFIDWFFDRYKETFGADYCVQGAKDGNLVKGLLKRHSLDNLKAMAAAMLESEDNWILSNADIGLIKSRENTWVKEIKGNNHGTNRKRNNSAGSATVRPGQTFKAGVRVDP